MSLVTCHASHVTRHRRVVSFVHSIRQRHDGGNNYTLLEAGGQALHQRTGLTVASTAHPALDHSAAADDDFDDDSDATVELGPRGLDIL
jgi:hypothetical protein